MPKSQGDSFGRLLNIAQTYKQQADKCAKVKAYHASSIFLASAIEGLILAMYYCSTSEARKTTTYQYWKGRKKNILYWDFSKLISLAKELDWIPGIVAIGRSTYSVSDAVDKMRELRNTIHPGNYFRTRRGKLVSVKDFKHTTRIFLACVDSLEAVL